MTPELPKQYRPSENEPFMNPRQREYFRLKLVSWREELLKKSQETLSHLQEESTVEADITGQASFEEVFSVELKARERERKLLSKIDHALLRLQKGEYGYCCETGEPIGVKRLEARPVATLSLEAQERHERHERTYRSETF